MDVLDRRELGQEHVAPQHRDARVIARTLYAQHETGRDPNVPFREFAFRHRSIRVWHHLCCEVRSKKMNGNAPPSPDPESPAPRRLRFRRFAWAGALILPFVLLATPPGQRLAIRHIVQLLHSSLPEDADRTDIHIGSVGIDYRPIGIALHDVRWTLADTDAALVGIESLTVQPRGLGPDSWNLIHLEGVHVDSTLLDWLDPILAKNQSVAEDTPTPTISVRTLSLKDIRVSLPAHWTKGAGALSILVHEVAVSDVVWNGKTPKWSDSRVLLEASGRMHDAPFAAGIDARGAPEALVLGIQDESQEGGFPINVGPSEQVRLTRATVQADLSMREADITLNTDGGTLKTELAWSSDSLEVMTLTFDLPSLSPVNPSLANAEGRLDLIGPLSVGLDDLTSENPEWGMPAIRGIVECQGELTVEGHIPTTLSGKWTPSSGDLEIRTSIHPASGGIPGHILDLSMEGRLPEWTPELENQASDVSFSLEGDWSVRTTGQELGMTSGSGRILLGLERNSADSLTGRFEVNGTCAPLTLSESLELFGLVDFEGEINLTDAFRPQSWWAHFDVTDSRWITRTGFGSNTRVAAPLAMHRFSLQARGDDREFLATLDGDFVKGRMRGPLDPQYWTDPVQEALASGGFAEHPESVDIWKEWTVDLTLLRNDLLERWSAGTRSVGPQSRLTGSYVNGALESHLNLTALHSDELRTGPLTLSMTGGTSALHVELEAQGARYADMGRLESVALDAAVSTGTQSRIALEWDAPFSGRIEVSHQLEGDLWHIVTPMAVSLTHASGQWNLDVDHPASFRWTGVDWRSLEASGFELAGPLGRLKLDSETDSTGAGTWLGLDADGVPTETLPGWAGAVLKLELPEMTGTLNGSAAIDLRTLRAKANVEWQDARIPPYQIGDLCVDLAWDDSWSGSVQHFVDEEEVLSARLNAMGGADLALNHLPLQLLNPLLDKAGVNLAGTAQGSVEVIRQDDGLPLALGRIQLDIPELHVDATGGQHSVEGTFRLEPGFMGMDQALVTDRDGHHARLNLSILHEAYAHWNYDLGIEIGQAPFKVMDLPPGADRLFHGTVYATGQLDVSGDNTGVTIETILRSEAGTRFTLPLDALEGTDIPNGIQFVGGEVSPPSPDDFRSFDLGLSLQLEVTPEAELALVLDGKAGERVDGRASGVLEIAQSPALPLTVEGGLDIVEGHYRFSLRDLFTKRIDIAPGGRIDWDGDPYSAELDLLAFSSLRANPAPLLPGVVDPGKTRVEVGMGILGALEAPRLEFDVAFPEYEESNPAMHAEVQAALVTPEAMERQAFALLATGQFIPSGAQGAFLSQTAAAQASELVSARISEWLSGLSEDVDIGLRYVPSAASTASTASSDEEISLGLEEAFELDLGLSLMNDRLQISGSLGARGMDGFSLQGSEFRGELDVRYRLTADGRWELQAYRLPESQLDEVPKQGIGTAYQLRFDRLGDLFRRAPTAPEPHN